MFKRPAVLAVAGTLAGAALGFVIAIAPGAPATAAVGGTTPRTDGAPATSRALSDDTIPPSVPTGLAASVTCTLQVTLRWTASNDNVGVTGYDVYRGSTAGFFLAGTTTTTTFTERLTNGFHYMVRARDAAGNTSAFTAPVLAAPPPCPPPDMQAPTVPGTPTARALCRAAELAWTASTDNVGVTGYEIWRATGTSSTEFQLVGTSTTTTYTDSVSVSPVRYQVRARDAARNLSTFTPPITVYVALGCPEDPPPATGCSAAYSLVNSWSGGFQGQVSVTNTGSNPTTSWTVTLTFANGQRITQIWGGRTNDTASPYAITNESYNGALAPNASTSFGFLGTSGDTNAAPTVACARTP